MIYLVYYFRQIDRITGSILGYVTYNNYYPKNDNPDIILEELSFEEFIAQINNTQFEETNENEEELEDE